MLLKKACKSTFVLNLDALSQKTITIALYANPLMHSKWMRIRNSYAYLTPVAWVAYPEPYNDFAKLDPDSHKSEKQDPYPH